MNLAPLVYQFLSAATAGAKGRTARHPCLTRDSNPRPLVQQPVSINRFAAGRRFGGGVYCQNPGAEGKIFNFCQVFNKIYERKKKNGYKCFIHEYVSQ